MNPTDAQNERGSILKPLLLVLALLAVSVSLTYAMVVTKASVTAKKEKENHTITLDKNPVCVGNTVTITVAHVEAGDKDLKVYVHLGSGAPSTKDPEVSGTRNKKNEWVGTYTASPAGTYTVIVHDDNEFETKNAAKSTAVQLTGIKVSKHPNKSGWHDIITVNGIKNYVALKSPDKKAVVTYEVLFAPATTAATNYAKAHVDWSTGDKGLTTTLKADKEAGPTPVTASLCNSSQIMTNWIMWARIEYNFNKKIDDLDALRFDDRGHSRYPLPASEAEYAGQYHGPDANGFAYVVRNKLEIKGIIEPNGIGNVLDADTSFTGFTFNRQIIEHSRDWPLSSSIADKSYYGKTRPDLAFTEGENLQTKPIRFDRIFATDIPGCNGVDDHGRPAPGYEAMAADFSNRIYINATTENIPASDSFCWHSFIKAHFIGTPPNNSEFVVPTGFGDGNPNLPKHWNDSDDVWKK